MDVWGHGHLVVTEKILLPAVEIVQRTIYTVVEKREVKTDIPVFTFLPFEVGVDILAGSPYLEIFTILVIVAEARHGVDREIASEILITGHTIVCTDLKVVDPLDIFHK